MLKNQEIAITGAGIGGLAAAVALSQRGAKVRVFEQAHQISEVGAGLQVSPNGMVVLDALGLGDMARERAIQSRGIWLRDGLTGKDVIDFDLEALAKDKTFLLFHRADLQSILLEAARDAGVEIETGRKVVSVFPDAQETYVGFADDTSETVNFLVGADGLHSVVRPVLNPPTKPFFTGQVAWRALVPATARNEVIVYMGPGRHMVTYPLRDGTMTNLVAVEERENWSQEGWFHKGEPENLRAAFAEFCTDAQDILNQVDNVFVWGLHRHPVAMEWHRGRSVILGDAAHPTLPFMAQGAVMALEDAWVLADCLDSFGLKDGPALYQARRRHRAERVVEAANKNARNYHVSNPVARGLGYGALKIANRFMAKAAFRRFDWIYNHDVTQE